MQKEGEPQFIHAHSGIVKGVAFSPKDRYTFCSGGTDGKVNVYNALRGGQLMLSTRITSPHAMKNINAVKFNADGSRILSTTSNRLSVIDVDRGDLVCSFDNCTYSSRSTDRSPLAIDPRNPNLAICGCTKGRGLITFDLRKPRPAHFALDVHSSLIKDIIFLDESWPFGSGHQGNIVSLSLDGICKIRSLDDREIHVLDVKHLSNCVTATPNIYSTSDDEGFENIMMIGGENLSGYVPAYRGQDPKMLTYGLHGDKPIYKLKYTSNGHILYAISSKQLRRYQRFGARLHFLGVVYSHNDEVIDMDISPNDEYVITASKDGNIGLHCLGAPSYGWTGFMQLA